MSSADAFYCLWLPISGAPILLQAGIREIAIDGRIGLLATTYAELHRDPADRLIVATAMTHNAVLVTADSEILAWKAGLTTQDAKT